MSDSVIFPRGTIVKKVYSYTLEYENKEVSVVFLNYGDYQHTGADHSCAIELREDFETWKELRGGALRRYVSKKKK